MDVCSNKGMSLAQPNALPPLLEPLSALACNCPFARVRFDMRWISWLLASSNRDNAPVPLHCHCRGVDVSSASGRASGSFRTPGRSGARTVGGRDCNLGRDA